MEIFGLRERIGIRFYMGDPTEHDYHGHSKILSPTLSLSLSPPHHTSAFKGMSCIEIFDIDGLIHTIQNALLNDKLHHHISWLNKAVLLEKAEVIKCIQQILPIYNIKYDPTKKCDPLQLQIGSIYVRKIDYYDPSTSVKSLSIDAVRRTWNLSNKFELEAELRIELNISSLLDMNHKNPEPALHHLIEYIKLQCPNMRNYCKLI